MECTAPEADMTTFDTTLRWTITDTEIGPCMAITGPAGVREIRIREHDPEAVASQMSAVRDDDGLRAIAETLAGLVDGSRTEFPFPVDLDRGTAFQRAVWTELRRIERGETVTYGELAARIDKPGAARAVGGAVGANPVPIVVPCHRVLAAGEKLGGYSGGLDVKRHLLRVEGVEWREE